MKISVPVSGLALVLIVSAGCATAPRPIPEAQANGKGGLVSMMTTADGTENPCMLYVPPEYDPARSWPLIIFLHGAGERGDDGVSQTRVGLGPQIDQHPERFPCLVLMPQCPRGSVWGRPEHRAIRNAEDASAHIDDGLRQVLAGYNIDPNRISLTGLSMGGYGSFLYGAKHVDQFSAIMPICGGGNTEDAATLAQVPMQVFHGADDTVVPTEQSRRMVEAIRGAGGTIGYTEFPNTGHNSWDQAYENPETIAWLLGQVRK